MSSRTWNLTGEDQFAEPDGPVSGPNYGPVTVVVAGTWVGIITISVKLDASSFVAQRTLTENEMIPETELPYNARIRVGFETGDFTSGTANVTISPA